MEIWKDIKGYEGYYQVSDLGNIRSLDRLVNKRRPFLQPGINIRQKLSKSGYMSVTFRKNMVKKTINVHRLVCIAFIENPNNLPIINHIDGNKTNNKIENLEWISHKGNVDHAVLIGLKKVTI